MLKLEIKRTAPGCADGIYTVRGKGCMAAVLQWADAGGPLSNWTSFAVVPMGANGRGIFRYTGQRGVPAEATHVYARAIRYDLETVEEALEPFPEAHGPAARGDQGAGSEEEKERTPAVQVGILTDLHYHNKPWVVKRALAQAAAGLAGTAGAAASVTGEHGADLLLCTGDMTNDGAPEQFGALQEMILGAVPAEIPLLAVPGNHDYPLHPLPLIPEGVCDVPALQQWLWARAEAAGCEVERDGSGAYAASFRGLDIVGLNAASQFRRLGLKKDGQIAWLAQHLEQSQAQWHLILCHAPLLSHNPKGHENQEPYFGGDGELQRLLDRHHHVIFLSGHTHLSFGCLSGCAEWEGRRKNVYLNCGSVRPTTLIADEPLQPEEWTEGNWVSLSLTDRHVEIQAVSADSGKKIARGLYRFPLLG